MTDAPLGQEPEHSRREIAIGELHGLDSHCPTRITVPNVEVGWRMVVVVHDNRDSEEVADSRHRESPDSTVCGRGLGGNVQSSIRPLRDRGGRRTYEEENR